MNDTNDKADIYDTPLETLDGTPATLRDYAGKVLLVVNTASKCGYTPQYAGLERLHATYQARGLAVLGFPCDQFGHQEPGSNEEIGEFCTTTYQVTFPMYAKTDVNGKNAHPLFRILTETLPGVFGIEFVKWNFTKFLIDRSGKPVERFAPGTKPEEMIEAIEALLAR